MNLQSDIRDAESRCSPLPARWYVDPAIFAFEQNHLLSKSWHLLGPHRARLAQKGDFITNTVIGVPVLLTNDGSKVAGFVNVCRHRGHAIATAEGNSRDCTLRCPYHGWSYNFNGSLQSIPRAEHETDLCLDSHALTPIQVAVWGEFVFANLSIEAPSFEAEYATLKEVLKVRDLDISSLTYYRSIDVKFSCNWKIYISNSLEAYHVSALNPAVFDAYDPFDEGYPVELYDSFVYTTLTARPGNLVGPREWVTVIVPPMVLISRSGSGAIRIRRIDPTGPQGVNVTTYYMVPEGADLAAIDREADTYATALGREVRDACESVQSSMAALAHVPSAPGRLLAASEPGVVWLTQWLRVRLFPASGDDNPREATS